MSQSSRNNEVAKMGGTGHWPAGSEGRQPTIWCVRFASMLGVIVGVFIMGTVNNAMNLKNVDAFWQYVVSGGILLAPVLFDRLKQKVRR